MAVKSARVLCVLCILCGFSSAIKNQPLRTQRIVWRTHWQSWNYYDYVFGGTLARTTSGTRTASQTIFVLSASSSGFSSPVDRDAHIGHRHADAACSNQLARLLADPVA